TTSTGRIRRYGTDPRATRPQVRRRRCRDQGVVSAAIAIPSGSGLLGIESKPAPSPYLRAVQNQADVVARVLRSLLHRQLALQDGRQHVPQDIAVLDVDPV